MNIKMIKHLKSSMLIAAIVSSQVHGGITTYTTGADFSQGTLNGVSFSATNELQMSETGTTFPIFWVANAGDASFSKVDTDANNGAGCEVARYKTHWSTSSQVAPSRTAVNVDGDVYLANRHFDNAIPDLIKFSADGGIDRNGNGVIDTSIDLNGNCVIEPNEMLPVVDNNGDGILDIGDFADERVLWVKQFGTPRSYGRSLCLDTDGNAWAGTYNTREYYKFDPNGNLIAGPIDTGVANYGCAVDNNGILWGASLGRNVLELDTNTDSVIKVHATGKSNYGIALGNNKVYLGSTLHSIDRTTKVIGPTIGTGGTGVAIDGDGAVWHGQSFLRKYEVNPTTGLLNTTPVCSINGTGGTRGPIIDSKGHAWTVNGGRGTINQYDTNCNFVSTLKVGAGPYTYSDATGLSARTQTDPSGIWTIIEDSGEAGTPWKSIFWNQEPEASIPVGASISVEARAADSRIGLSTKNYVDVDNGVNNPSLNGQLLQVRTVLRPNQAGDSPVLSDLSIETTDSTTCDANDDGFIDRLDIRVISRHRNVPINLGNAAWDINGDGLINVTDGRACVAQCTLARCAITVPR